MLQKIIFHSILVFCQIQGATYSTMSPVVQAKAIEGNLAKVTDSLCMCKYEVSNKEYNDFLASIRGTDNYHKNLEPDTALWLSHPYNAHLHRHYHRNSLFANHPVVAISYSAAIAYCNWLTTQYMANRKKKFKRVKFRLPTEAEWMHAASGGKSGLNYPWGNYLRSKTGEQMAVFRYIGDTQIGFDSTSQSFKIMLSNDEIIKWDGIPAVVRSFYPNPLGMYHVSGNVAEMVAEPGLTKGGCYNDAGYDIRIQSKKYYTGPSIEVGFRVAMEILP